MIVRAWWSRYTSTPSYNGIITTDSDTIAKLTTTPFRIPDPDSESSETLNEDGLLATLSQQAWQVTFAQYAEGGGQMMPRRLTAVDDDIKVRLVIDEWTFR